MHVRTNTHRNLLFCCILISVGTGLGTFVAMQKEAMRLDYITKDAREAGFRIVSHNFEMHAMLKGTDSQFR